MPEYGVWDTVDQEFIRYGYPTVAEAEIAREQVAWNWVEDWRPHGDANYDRVLADLIVRPVTEEN